MADMLTKGAFTTLQWKSLLRLFDIHTPRRIRCQSPHFRIILFCTVVASLLCHVQRLQLTARLRERTRGPSYGVVCQRSAWGNSCGLAEAPSDKTPHRTNRTRPPAHPVFVAAVIVQVRTLALVFQPSVRSLTFLDAVGAVPSPCVLRRQYSG